MPPYWELVKALTAKDFKLRYRNSAFGFAWSLLNPLAMMGIMTLVFSTLLRSGIENFPLFLLPALLAWRFFSIGTSMALWSVLNNAPLVSKVYFPRWLLILSSNLANLLGSLLEFLALLPLMALLGMRPSPSALLLPLILALEFLLIFAISLPLSALNVYYRDVHQVWDIALQAGFFLTPIFYSADLIPGRYLGLYLLNPMARIVQCARKIFYLGSLPEPADFGIPLLETILLLALGAIAFSKLEPRFAEEV
ncbi:MAG: ABC transporter permease [Candidatus Bathyarchaeia archaeon]